MKQSTPPTSRSESPFRRVLHDIADYLLRYGVPLAVSVLLIVWLFHKVDFKRVMDIIHHEVRWEWIALMMIITTLSHMVRGLRWGLQLKTAGIPPVPKVVLYNSIFGNYALNLLFPRLGEVWRGVYVANYTKSKFTTVFGTVMGDRLADAIAIILLTVLMFCVASGTVDSFLEANEPGGKLISVFENPWLYIGIAGALSCAVASYFIFRKTKIMQKVHDAVANLWQGFISLFKMKRMGLFCLETLGIWGCYFLETYVCFFAFPFTRELVAQPGLCFGLIPGLVSLVFSSFSMAVPSNGGLGPWNITVMFALSLYGISNSDGAAFALTVWSCQAIMLVLLGLWTLAYISIHKRQNK